MNKHSYSKRETQLDKETHIGKQLEQTVTVEDETLPSPEEIKAYKEIDPRIIDYLLDSSKSEQEHRHKTDLKKLSIISHAERNSGRMNWWGMFFASFAIISFIVLAGFSLYLDHPWFATCFFFGSLVSIVSIFTGKGKNNTK